MTLPARLLTPVLGLALALAMASVGFAQSGVPADEDHAAHHPPAAAAPAQSAPHPGRMPTGTMSRDGQHGMMDGDMRQMMAMMRQMMTMMSAHSGMMTPNAEGRIASLKAELKITDGQTAQWDRFADALRGTAKSMNGMYERMMAARAGTSLPDRLDHQEAMLSDHLKSIKALKDALGPLYASFTDEQKKIADGMMIDPMGMM
jgi:hypothetical protein